MVIGKGSQGSRVMRILERENYYNVINGYKELFLASKATATTDEVYKTGTTFDEVYALYNFDRELRNIYLKYLLKLENTFKTVIARAADGSYTYGTNDAYAIAIMFVLLLSKSDLNDFISSMRIAFGKLQKKLHTISVTDIMSIMGYDVNWTNLAKLM